MCCIYYTSVKQGCENYLISLPASHCNLLCFDGFWLEKKQGLEKAMPILFESLFFCKNKWKQISTVNNLQEVEASHVEKIRKKPNE